MLKWKDREMQGRCVSCCKPIWKTKAYLRSHRNKIGRPRLAETQRTAPMKPGIHFIFLILLQGFAGTLQAEDPSSKKATSNKPISYAAIDQRAIKAPPSAETSVESLAEYLG